MKRAETTQPNLLVIFSDEHHWRASGYMGHAVVETPNLDRLAAEGVNFTNAYCTSPLCSPSRQSLMSGLHCHRIGMWDNVSGMPENTVTWAHALHAAGYETTLCGKMHFNGYQKLYGFDRRPVKEGNNDGQEFYSWGYRTSHEWAVPAPERSEGRCPDWVEAGPDSEARQPIFRHDAKIVAGTLDALREKAVDRSGKPWALCCSTVLPHPPFTARADLFARYQGRGEAPHNPYGEGLGECDRSIRVFHRMDANDYTVADLVRLREAYYGLVTEFDEYVGQILACLEETGLAEDTVVCYLSDHGELGGEHGMIGKVMLKESSVRVPLLLRWPGRLPVGATVDTPVSLVDLYPTFLDLAHYQLPAVLPLDGNSLLPLVAGETQPFADRGVFCEFEGEGWPHPRAFVRVGDYKYVYYHTAPPELFNVREDYYESENLAGKPAYAAVEAELRARLLSEWDPARIEIEVLRNQARQKLAPCRNVCGDVGW